jgi:hypothetical protein
MQVGKGFRKIQFSTTAEVTRGWGRDCVASVDHGKERIANQVVHIC